MSEVVSFHVGTPTLDLHSFHNIFSVPSSSKEFLVVNARSLSNARYTQCRWQCTDIIGREACYKFHPTEDLYG